ncbi:hypothetical protein K504DRAFT_368296 [Pleomassaria siparia CBS 279.74]|uniref:DUF1446-domain-containing protein n=1 Tax=Pleomassaria siparia CBS 279.74 TaxID=1314801 RepID=A0A6G1KRW7_9PLEO|nr:hypothetical protein K504DRAFT_368296 [Pleomassaria siparia CBS 279.74]
MAGLPSPTGYEDVRNVPKRDALMPICQIVTPIGMLGYGFNQHHTASLLAKNTSTDVPTAIILDSGSTDGGPSKLANGKMTQPRSSYVRDLTKLIDLVVRFNVPLIFSSAGGDGSDEHVREMLGVVEEITAREGNEHYKLKTIAVFSEIPKTLVLERLHSGASITGCGTTVPVLTDEDINSATKIVSQMGPEPLIDAMRQNQDFDMLIAGRAYDPSPYVAFAAFASKTWPEDTATLASQRLWGGFTHMGKILECGGICATPKSAGAGATVYADGTFDITPLDPEARCTPISVSAHTLYEKSRPDLLYGPGGWLDLSKSEYAQLEDQRTCRVKGGQFTFSTDAGLKYQVKLEAATVDGYRAMFLGSIKDRESSYHSCLSISDSELTILTRQIDAFLGSVKGYVKSQVSIKGTWDLDFHIYGKDAASSLPDHIGEASEVFLVAEALGSSQELATSVTHTAKVATIHGPYSGQKATSGNLAHGVGGKAVFESGPSSRFCVYHLMALEEGEERLRAGEGSKGLFTQTVTVIGKGEPAPSTDGIVPTASPAQYAKKDTKIIVKGPEDARSLPTTLSDISRVLRSKNAGPYEITFDIMFDTDGLYRLVKTSDILNRTTVAKLLEVGEEDIIWIGFFDQARAFKVTIPRFSRGKPVAGGGFMENDIHGSQKYMGLSYMKLEEGFVNEWKRVVGWVEE